mmetsp:Transcript_22945/g.54444  ORF Transcript_22945/g.54444 Transcript_22945/m.54444 type:complete len:855 (-) Transcript_22945:169-2733(-)
MAVSPKRNTTRRHRYGGGADGTGSSGNENDGLQQNHYSTPRRQNKSSSQEGMSAPSSSLSSLNIFSSSSERRPRGVDRDATATKSTSMSTRFSDPVLTPRSQRHSRSTSNYDNNYNERSNSASHPSPSSFLWEAHAMFWLSAVGVKWFLPSTLKWVAHDSVMALVVSVWIPVIMTIFSIDDRKKRNEQHNQYLQYERNKNKKYGEEESHRWLRYWSMGYAVVQVGRQFILFIAGTLFMHRHHQGGGNQASYFSSNFPVHVSEIQFFTYLYMFTLNQNILSTYSKYRTRLIARINGSHNDVIESADSAVVASWEPLAIMDEVLRPYLLNLQSMVSEPISKDVWQRYIHDKAQRLLDVLVMLQFLSDEWQEYLLQLLDEGRSLLVLSIFFVLPSSLTQIGITYVKFILPSARYCSVKSFDSTAMTAGYENSSKEEEEEALLYLQYWVVNVMLSSCLSVCSWLYWFIPFSTQIVFAVWCYLTFPRTIQQYYAVVEMELVTFGFLSGESQVPLQKAKTVRLLKTFVKRIPSANDAEGFRWADSEEEDSDIDSDNGDSASIVSYKRRKRTAKSKNLRTLGARTKSSPSGLRSFSSSPTRTRGVSSTEKSRDSDDDEMENRNYDDFVNQDRSKGYHSRNKRSDQTASLSLLGSGGSDDSSVAAVCNTDFSSSSHSRYASTAKPRMTDETPFWEQSSSFRCEPFISSTSSATSDEADGDIDGASINATINTPRSQSRRSQRSRSRMSYSNADENQMYGQSDSINRSSSNSYGEHLDSTASFEGGHMFDGSIRELRRSLRGVQSHIREVRTDRVRRQIEGGGENPHQRPGYLRPTESSSRQQTTSTSPRQVRQRRSTRQHNY